jgi:hypothetical protein
MSRRKCAICLLVVATLAGVTVWFLWRGGGFDFSNAWTGKEIGELTIIEIPRPNSLTYTEEEATALLPKTIAQSRAVDPQHPLVAQWKSPTNGFRVHVTAKNEIETVDVLGEKRSGMAGLILALQTSQAMQWSNPLSVLLTSETDGWHGDDQRKILDLLFRPSIQLYMVTDK